MKEILLSQGKVALVDEADYELLNSFKWYAKYNDCGSWYAVRKERKNERSLRGSSVKKKDPRKTIRMHNLIMNPTKGNIAHHRDGDGLNNQKYNLQIVAEIVNQQEAMKKAHDKRYNNVAPF